MGLISKLTGHTSSSDNAKTATGHTQPDLDNRTGTNTASTGSAGSTAPHSLHATGENNRSTGEKVRDILEPGHTGSGPAAHPQGSGVGSATSSSSSTTTSSNNYDNTRGTDVGSAATGAHSTTGSTHQTGDNRTTGEKMKDAVLPGHHSSSSTSSTHGHDSTRGSTGSSSSSVHQQSGRLGELNLNEHDLSSAKGEHTVKHAAPVVAEHVHDRYEHVDKTRVEELRQRTEVTQTVQPVYDEVKHGTTHERVDHGLEVHEHGHRGLDKEAEAELARKREQIAREHRSTHDEETRQTSLRPDVNVHHRTNVVEEVVPVIEKDIYRPHEIEHVKHEVHVHHEAPVVKSTTVAAPISIAEYEKVSGVKLHGLQSSDHATRETLTTDKHTHGTHGGVTGSHVDTTSTGTHGVGSHSSSSTGTHSTGDNRTIGEKIKDTVLPGHHSGSSSSSGTTTTGSSSSTGYDNSRSTTGTHGSTGMGSTTGTHSTGVSGQHTGVTDSNYGDNRTTGEKVKDTVTPGHHEATTGHNTHTGASGHTGVTGQAERGLDQKTGHPGLGQQAVNAGERATGHNTQNAQGQKFAGGHVLPNTGNTNTRL